MPSCLASATASASIQRVLRTTQAPEVVEEVPEVLDLDAIFRKTMTEPELYWLPLTEEQAAARAAAKAKASSDAAPNDKGPQLNGSATDVKARH